MAEEILEIMTAEADTAAAIEAEQPDAAEAETHEDGGEGTDDIDSENLRRFLNARHAREIIADMRMKKHFGRLSMQAAELKNRYPDFDLAREMQNPVFARLTAPGVEIDPETAYEIVHRQSLREAARREDVARISRAVASGSMRPAENALYGSHASRPVKTDPRTLSSGERRDIRRRVERGERVTF